MRLLRRKPRPPAPPRPEIADELESVARRLRGWTVSGSGGVDLEDLLWRAAAEIRRAATAAGVLYGVTARPGELLEIRGDGLAHPIEQAAETTS